MSGSKAERIDRKGRCRVANGCNERFIVARRCAAPSLGCERAASCSGEPEQTAALDPIRRNGPSLQLCEDLMTDEIASGLLKSSRAIGSREIGGRVHCRLKHRTSRQLIWRGLRGALGTARTSRAARRAANVVFSSQLGVPRTVKPLSGRYGSQRAAFT
jgi:hypothetical protein